MRAVAPASPRTRARITGVVYLLFFVTVILGAVLSPATSGLTDGLADAAATAKSILAHEGAYRLAWALTLISTAFYVALMALFYQLFRPVSRTFALLAGSSDWWDAPSPPFKASFKSHLWSFSAATGT